MSLDIITRHVPGQSRLITDRNEPVVHTANRETDTRTALTRGLKEYIEQLSIDAPGGRQFVFQQVFESWAEPENEAAYPSAYIYSTSAGTYDASKFTPVVNHKQRIPPPDGRYIVGSAELNIDLTIEAWCTDPEERNGVMAMLEAALNPVDFMYGFRLELPHYFNARGEYELLTTNYYDSEEEAVRRYRRAVMTVRARVPLINIVSAPLARPRVRVDAVGPDVVVHTEVQS